MKKATSVLCTVVKKECFKIYGAAQALTQQLAQLDNPTVPSLIGGPGGYEAKTEDGRTIFIHENINKPLNLEVGQTAMIRREPSYAGLAYRDLLLQKNDSFMHVFVEW